MWILVFLYCIICTYWECTGTLQQRLYISSGGGGSKCHKSLFCIFKWFMALFLRPILVIVQATDHKLSVHTQKVWSHRSYTLTKIVGKIGEEDGFFPQMSQNENIVVKMGESFAHDKKYSHFEKKLGGNLSFSHDFCQCMVGVSLIHQMFLFTLLWIQVV